MEYFVDYLNGFTALPSWSFISRCFLSLSIPSSLPLSLLQVRSTSCTQGQSPPPAWSSTCARARQRRTRRRGQSSRSSRPDVPTDPPKSSTRETPLPDAWAGPERPLNPQHTCPLSLVSALTESVDAPHFSSTTSKNKPTSIAQRRCLWGAWRWNEAAWRGWMRFTHTLITFCGQRGEQRACFASTPPTPLVFNKRGLNTCPNAGTCHLSHTHTHTQLSLLVLLLSLLVS